MVVDRELTRLDADIEIHLLLASSATQVFTHSGKALFGSVRKPLSVLSIAWMLNTPRRLAKMRSIGSAIYVRNFKMRWSCSVDRYAMQ